MLLSSFLTYAVCVQGESEPVARKPTNIEENPLEATNIVFSGRLIVKFRRMRRLYAD